MNIYTIKKSNKHKTRAAETILPGVSTCVHKKIINICRVRIPEFIHWVLPDFPYLEYRHLASKSFRSEDFRILFLSEKEIARLNGFKSLKKQAEWMCGRFAAKFLGMKSILKTASTMDLLYLPDIRILTTEKGAPYLPDINRSALSISHSHDYAVAALISEPGFRMGIDIEKIASINKKEFLDIAFSEKEKSILVDADESTVTSGWSMKEAVLKLMGEGFHKNLKEVETVSGFITINGQGQKNIKPETFHMNDGYVLTLAYEKACRALKDSQGFSDPLNMTS